MEFSRFGRRHAEHRGTRLLMDDLGTLSAGDDAAGQCFLGGGAPAILADVQDVLRRHWLAIAGDERVFEHTVARYDQPQGDAAFIDTLAGYLNQRYGWGLKRSNILITPGSQMSFFMLFNLFAGAGPDGPGRVLLPMLPEYIGYGDVTLDDDMLLGCRPLIEMTGPHAFKYRIDFDNLPAGDRLAAICASRPTNPTGNVFLDAEIDRLRALARDRDVPLIIDNAYGAPFPDIIHTRAALPFDDHLVLCMSFSKLGLPGLRTGIIIARDSVIDALVGMNAALALSPSRVATTIVQRMIEAGELDTLVEHTIRPFYRSRAAYALSVCHEVFDGLPYAVHEAEGAFFLWLWFPDLPITALELYQRLKQRGVVVLPGHYFFPGLDAPWRHADECIRISYAQDEITIREGLGRIAAEIRSLVPFRDAGVANA